MACLHQRVRCGQETNREREYDVVVVSFALVMGSFGFSFCDLLFVLVIIVVDSLLLFVVQLFCLCACPFIRLPVFRLEEVAAGESHDPTNPAQHRMLPYIDTDTHTCMHTHTHTHTHTQRHTHKYTRTETC